MEARPRPGPVGHDLLDVGPLSFQQEDMLRSMRTHPAGVERYDNVHVFELRGHLDTDRLEEAVADIAAHHGSLRTVLSDDEGGLAQRVVQPGRDGLPVGRLAPDRIGPAIEGLVAARYDAESVVGDRPLCRAGLHELGPDHHLLHFLIHHLIADGWAVRLIWQNLSEAYSARLDEREPELDAPSESYLDFAFAQRASWPDIGPAAIGFWRQVVGDSPAQVEWPGGKVAGPDAERRAVRSVLLPPSLQHTVRETARAGRVTPFLVLLAATGTAVARVTEQKDILLATDIANRVTADAQNLVGMLLNTKMTKLSSADESSLLDQMAIARSSWLEADDHRDAYIDQVLREIGSPAFVRVDTQTDGWTGSPALPGVAVQTIPVSVPTMHWRPIDVMWVLGENGFSAEISYRRTCLDDTCVDGIAMEILRMLEDPRVA